MKKRKQNKKPVDKKKRAKEYYQKNRERILKRVKAYRLKNRDKINRKVKRIRKKNRRKIHKHYRLNKARYNAYSKKWYWKNRHKVKVRRQKYWKKNKKRLSRRNRRWLKVNKVRRAKYKHIVRRTPRTRWKVAWHNATLRDLPFKILFRDYKKIISNPCYYCGKDLTNETGGSLDRKDNNQKIGYILSNVLPCCGTCNVSRADHYTVREFKVMAQALVKFRKKNKK